MGRPAEIQFPLLGLNKGVATSKQPFATTFLMHNMRLYDVLNNRARGGQRPAVIGWGDEDLIGDANNPVVAMCTVSSLI